MPLFSPDDLQALARAVFLRMGAAPDEAEIVASHLVGSNLAGHDSHGVGVIPGYVRVFKAGLLIPNQTLKTVLDAGALLQFDGRRGFGQRMTREAVAHGIARAKQLGACVMGVRNTAHLGRVGTYAEQCSDANCAFIAFVNVADHLAYQAPYAGRDAKLGTNPICAAVPGPDGPSLMLDAATTMIAFNKARIAHEKRVPVPEGALLDPEGRLTTDPTAMVERHEGALTSFGLHKGSGLAVMCEALGAVLTGGKRADEEPTGGVLNSMLAVIIDTERMGGGFQPGFDAVAASVKSARPAAGFTEVLLPGEPERRSRAERSVTGIPISDGGWAAITEAARQMGLGDAELALAAA